MNDAASALKVLFVSAEVSPLAMTGGLGDVVGALSARLRQSGLDVRVAMPLYKSIKERYASQLTFRRWAMIKLGWRSVYSGLLSMDFGGVTIYFIDNDYYFGHDKIYVDYAFDIERFSFFQRAVLEALGQPMDFEPDILHIHDWQTAMIPCLLEAHYKSYGYHRDLRTVLTIHNLKYQGIYSRERIADLLDMPDRCMTDHAILKDGVPNFLKAGIVFADRITTVSPSYAEEIMTDYYGEGLASLLQSQAHKIRGLLNGIDEASYDPASDPQIAQNYGPDSFAAGKAACKAALQQELGLRPDRDAPLACLVSRLTEQKGIDLLIRILDDIHSGGLQLAVLGNGDPAFESALTGAATRFAGSVAVRIAFDSSLARRFYAGADLFLMPSLFEPCGLAQMIAMRYGALPVVRHTGGLRDTVTPFDPQTGRGNGFAFQAINPRDFLNAVLAARDLYAGDRASWRQAVGNAMREDFSWDRSAAAYRKLYLSLRD